MFGFSQKGVGEYARVSLETGVIAASPAKLIIMLYDGAIAACYAAIGHIQNEDFEKKGQFLSKAIMIIESGLRTSLDKKAGGDIAKSLDSLYGYISDRLYLANIKNQTEPVYEVIDLLAELRTAWEEIAKTPDVNKVSDSKAVAINNLSPAKV